METGTTELLGNEPLRQRLLELSRRDALHPCLLFEGPAGLGKARAALWLAAAINCAEAVPTEQAGMFGGPAPAPTGPCGQCWSCRAISEGNHPDIVRIGLDPEKTAPIISVRQARDVISRLTLHPYRARRRIVIIDPAEAMTEEAANALLKTFEEPPGSTGFVLVCDSAQRLLPTVRSRSQRVRFRPVPLPVLRRWLEERGVPDPAWIARLAEGCPGRALALAEGDAARWRQQRDALIAALRSPQDARFAYADGLTRGERAAWSERVAVTLDALGSLVRDALALYAGASPDRLFNADIQPLIASWAARLQVEGCQRLADAVDLARQELAAFVNGRLLLDALLATVISELGSFEDL